jgi:hypothetical protein
MNLDITTTLWVALGGGLGGVVRHSIGTAIARLARGKALWGTLAVNILGSFLLGRASSLRDSAGRPAADGVGGPVGDLALAGGREDPAAADRPRRPAPEGTRGRPRPSSGSSPGASRLA